MSTTCNHLKQLIYASILMKKLKKVKNRKKKSNLMKLIIKLNIKTIYSKIIKLI